jgi:hypothetical protein
MKEFVMANAFGCRIQEVSDSNLSWDIGYDDLGA